MKYLYALVSLLVLSNSLQAQQPCGSDEYEKYLGQKFPGFTEALTKTRAQSVGAIQQLGKRNNDTVYRIPVVFHIVWNTPVQNIHDSLIYSQVKAFNESFRHFHKDTGNIREIFKPLAADSRLEFFLADKDPDGNPSTGIDRVYTSVTNFIDMYGHAEKVKSTSSKGVSPWNPKKYLNVWVCRFKPSGSSFVVAYATPPTNAQFWNIAYSVDSLQGLVVNYEYVGKGNPNDAYAGSLRERTLVHEAGHYFGLRHIWGDKQKTCFGEDDGLKDTPLASTSSLNCSTLKNTCNEGSGDKPDMMENYMDYTPYPCISMFTRQQIALMRYNLINLRPELAQPEVTVYPPDKFPKISVFPNPVLGDLTLQFEKEGIYTIELTDMLGQKVLEQPFEIKGIFERKFDTRNFASGVYHLSLRLNKEVAYQQRLVVE